MFESQNWIKNLNTVQNPPTNIQRNSENTVVFNVLFVTWSTLYALCVVVSWNIVVDRLSWSENRLLNRKSSKNIKICCMGDGCQPWNTHLPNLGTEFEQKQAWKIYKLVTNRWKAMVQRQSCYVLVLLFFLFSFLHLNVWNDWQKKLLILIW